MTTEVESTAIPVYCCTHRVLFYDDELPVFFEHANCERFDVEVFPMEPDELAALHAQARGLLKCAVTFAEKRSALSLFNEALFQLEIASLFEGNKAPERMPMRRPNPFLMSRAAVEQAYAAARLQ